MIVLCGQLFFVVPRLRQLGRVRLIPSVGFRVVYERVWQMHNPNHSNNISLSLFRQQFDDTKLGVRPKIEFDAERRCIRRLP